MRDWEFKIEGTGALRGAHRGLRLKVQGNIRGVLLRREQGTGSRAQSGGISLDTRRKAEEINGKWLSEGIGFSILFCLNLILLYFEDNVC